MAIISITYPARCKDCKFLYKYPVGKRKYSRCDNPESPRYTQNRRQRDLVCDKWKPTWV